ncbi:MAG TPA: hypothetical protein VD884_09215 [Ohtaekwangia sp.]|nr:hypothetical protein [Ohtaekwangia sp.]
MKTLISGIAYFLLFTCTLVFTSCDSNDDPSSGEQGGEKYVILSAAEKWEEGYITSFNDMPSGSISPIVPRSLQVNTSFGIRSFKNWFFSRSNTAGTAGLQRYSVKADGTISDDGFIANASQFIVIDETIGYYLDETRGKLKLQTFNPTTMQRTGEIDLSSLQNEEYPYQVIGKHTLAAKDGKLYAGMTYSTLETEGFGGDLIDYIEFVVIDIATNTYEKTITYEEEAGYNTIGWGSSANKMWTIGDDGALYLYSTGLQNGFTQSGVIRIKEGETDFDKTWRLDAHDLVAGSSIAAGLVKDGKMYIELPSTALNPDFSNLMDFIFDYYVVDLQTKEATKITGMPQHHYAYANEQAITEIDGKICFWVRNLDENIDAYYALNNDGTSATQLFNIDHDGFMWGLVKLDE